MTRRLGATFTLAAILVAGMSTIRAAEFEDDFERADGPVDGWTASVGEWNLVDGTMTTTAAGTENWVWAGAPPFRTTGDLNIDFNLSFGATPGDGVGNHGGIAFCASVATDRYDPEFSGYTVDWIDRELDHGIRVLRVDGGVQSPLFVGTPDVVDPPVAWRVEVEGDVIRFLGDDVLLAEVVDGTYRGGHFGAWAYQNGTQLTLDNVFVEFTEELVLPCYTQSTQAGPSPLFVEFDASCSTAAGEIATYEWDFGDGNSAEGVTVSHEFEFPDPYVVTLTVTDTDGNSATAQSTVTVFRSAAGFEDDFAREDGAPTGWTIAEGDWQLIDETLVMTDQGAESSIWAGEPPIALPPTYELSFDMAWLAYTPKEENTVGRHAGVLFSCSDPLNRFAPNNGYELDWIDRDTDHGLRLIRIDAGVGHTFIGTGAADLPDPPANWRIVIGPETIEVYGDDVLLMSVNDNTHRGGLFGFWSWTGAQQVAYDNVSIAAPDCLPCFSGPTGNRIGVNVDTTFDATCSSANVGEVNSWSWDFGDGNSATGEVVEHTYDMPGDYVVELTIGLSTGGTCTTERRITAFEVIDCFEDLFDQEPGEPVNWTVHSGSVVVDEDVEGLRVSATGVPESWAFAGSPAKRFDESVTTYSFEMQFLDVPPDGVGRHGGVMFCADGSTDRYTNSGYTFDWIDRFADQGYRFIIWTNGVANNLILGTDDTEPGEVWEIEIDGDIIRLIVDGELKIEVEETTYRGGHFGFWSFTNGTDYVVRNVEIGDVPCESGPRDSDGDGVIDGEDNCVRVANADQSDVDTDGVGDVCDNCPDVSNEGQQDDDGDGVGNACEDGGGDEGFIRGDTDGNGTLLLNDSIQIFAWLFQGGAEPGCVAAADASGQGQVNLTSGIYGLNFLFTGGGAPPAPYPECGPGTLASDAVLGCLEPHCP